MTTNINPAGTSYPMASLYVGNLHPDVSEAMLFEKFSTVGPVSGIRVCRDMITRRSLGYAYVNFQQPADAARAIETFNSDIIKGQQMRILWSKKDPVTGKSGGNTIFIKNLDRSVDNKALYDTFSVLGNILSCKIVCDEHGSRGYGFVHFETAEEAKDAIEKVNGMLINGKKVSVTFETSDHKIQEDTKEKFNNLYFKNFDNLSEEKLRDVFEPFGNIISLKIMTDVYGKSRGFGFVCYQNADEAQTAVEELNGALIGDNTFFVGRAQNKTERHAELKNQSRDLNVYVKNLDNNIDDDRLIKEFSQFGTITSAKVMTEGGRSKGFGFVCFRSPEDATKAVTVMNGRIIVAKPLYVALSQSREDRKAHLASQYKQRIESIRKQGQPAAGMMSQMFPSDGPGYILPTMTHGQRNLFAPTQVPQMMASPRWLTQLQQPTSASGFQNMPGQQVRSGNPVAARARQPGQANIHGGMNARPITGQSSTEQQSRMPQSVTENYMSEEFGQEEDSSPYDSSSSSSEDDICSTFCDIINELTLRSGNIDEITDVIVQMLQNCSDDHVMYNIIEHLFEKSIVEPDFQYTGAQLVKFLSNKLRMVPAFVTFRNTFITRCKEEYLKKQELISNPDKVPGLCGFVIFLGELFLNLEVTIGGVLQRIAVVRFMIRDLLLVLLELSTNETVTCATQVLERTGAIIEETTHLNKPEEGNFSEVFFRLQQLASCKNLNQATRASISSLLNLKSRDWVRGDSSQQHSMSSLSHYEQVYQESFIDSRPSLNNENTENEVQQLMEIEDSQSSIQGAMDYSSELVAETLITKEIESTGNGNQNLGDNTDDKYMCKICFDDPVEVTFLPCMHVCCCKNCSDKLKVKQCPICRKRIRQSRPLYFA